MSKVIIGVLAWLIITGVIYCSGSVANGTFEIFKWSEFGRDFIIMMWAILTIVGVLLAAIGYFTKED